ncbi:MAG: TPM domain-containing protein [Bacteroidetes bacterium]|jgi:uncharacterized protein|nr:TPM domain-containing protein [Bacteroidota bacterium]MDF1863583.1 TPM domain-containing protein [Saprospiraceae bacterium]
MKKYHFLISVLAFFIGTSMLFSQEAFTVETVPNPTDGGRGYVSDPNNYLSTSDKATLNSLIASLEDSSTAQIAVVVLESIGYDNPKEFTTRLFNHWGIGQADVDNGLLILSVMDQRRTEFETGYGLEGVLPDLICYRVGMQELVPHFKLGDYGAGLIAAVSRFKKILEDPNSVSEIRSLKGPGSRSPIPGIPVPLFWYILVNLIYHLAICIWVLLTLWNKEDLYDKYKSIEKVYGWWLGIPFPIPYFLIMPILKNQLKKLRNEPRFSNESGKALRKLSEEEEDEFLKSGQIIEEGIGSVDYDVWISADHEEILILRYARRFSKYSKCPKCEFKTYYLAHSHTVQHATRYSSGKHLKQYECKNCGYINQVYTTLPRITQSSGGGGFSGGGGGGSSFGGGSSGGGGAGVSW